MDVISFTFDYFFHITDYKYLHLSPPPTTLVREPAAYFFLSLERKRNQLIAAIKFEMETEIYMVSSLDSSDLYSQMPQGEVKARRRRKKAKIAGEGEFDAAEEGKKRRLSDHQVKFLEMNFGKERKLESCRKVHLASELGLDPKQVAVWFQNRRARWKSKQIEDEYGRLRSSHDAVLIEKCRLENEVLKLKDQLVQSKEEIKRLTYSGGGGGEVAVAGSPSSSMTTAAHFGDFGMDEVDSYYYMMELGYLYGMCD